MNSLLFRSGRGSRSPLHAPVRAYVQIYDVPGIVELAVPADDLVAAPKGGAVGMEPVADDGADVGFDSIADYEIAADLSTLLDAMECNDGLPKTILYTLNPKDNYVLATMIGNFQSAETAGKMQFGSAWWFNDQRDGMVEQMKALANLGALNKFVGMLTDSRSFLSYTRHEYFRRILCNMLGEWVENGEFSDDFDTLGKIVEDICFNNAKRYFNVEM